MKAKMKAKSGKGGIKNLAKPKAKKTSGARVSSSQTKGLRKQTKRIANDIGRAEGNGGLHGGFFP